MIGYMTAGEAAQKWNISHRRVITLCRENRIKNVAMLGNMWIIPSDAEKPIDGRTTRYENQALDTKDDIKSTRKDNHPETEQIYFITIEEIISENFQVVASSIEKARELAISNYKKGLFVLEPGNLEKKYISVHEHNSIPADFEEF